MKRIKQILPFIAVIAVAALFLAVNPFEFALPSLLEGALDYIHSLLFIICCVLGCIICLKEFSAAKPVCKALLAVCAVALACACWFLCCYITDLIAAV